MTVVFPRRPGLCCGLPASKRCDLLQHAPRHAESSSGSLCSALSGHPVCERREPVRIENLFWKTAVLHSHHVASPSELGLHDQDLNTWHAGTAKYLLVGDSVLPGNAQKPAEAAEVELVQFLEVSAVACPGLAAIQRGWEDNSTVDSKLRCLGHTALTPNSCPQAPKCAAGLG